MREWQEILSVLMKGGRRWRMHASFLKHIVRLFVVGEGLSSSIVEWSDGFAVQYA